MALTIELSPEIETELLAAAAREGVGPAEWAARALTERFAIASNAFLSAASDTTLLGILREELPDTFWQRYVELRACVEAEHITEAQRQELLPLIDRAESFNARRMLALAELARRRQVDPITLMAVLGVGSVQIPA